MSRPLLLLGHTGNAFGKHYSRRKNTKKATTGKIVSVQNKFEKQSGFKIILFDPITYLFDESQQNTSATKKQLHSYVEFLGFSLKVMRGVSAFFW